jgi:Uma2 family endonuclease
VRSALDMKIRVRFRRVRFCEAKRTDPGYNAVRRNVTSPVYRSIDWFEAVRGIFALKFPLSWAIWFRLDHESTMTPIAISPQDLTDPALTDSALTESEATELVLMSFEEFLVWHPENGRRFELIHGVPREMPNPIGRHEDIAGYLSGELFVHLRQSNPSWFVPKSATVKPDREKTGYKPDVVVLDRSQLSAEPLWDSSSSVIHGATIPLIIEVVSQNWRDDYDYKFSDYEAMGIREYWIVDFRAIASSRVLGKPKQPTITVCELVDDGYELKRYYAGDSVVSGGVPGLVLSVNDVFAAAVAG